MEPLSFRPNVSSLWERNSTCGAFGRYWHFAHIAFPPGCLQLAEADMRGPERTLLLTPSGHRPTRNLASQQSFAGAILQWKALEGNAQ